MAEEEKAQPIAKSCFPIEVLYVGEKEPTIVNSFEELKHEAFTVLRTRVK